MKLLCALAIAFALAAPVPACADGKAATKRILIYGDSNTWGWIPVEHGYPTTRYAEAKRWPGIAGAALGDGYVLIEEGLSGRTTDLADPTTPHLPGAGLDGSAYLPAAVASHLPLDLIVIMLGTNDLKAMYERSPERVAEGIGRLIELVKEADGGVATTYPVAQILVLAPPPIVATERFPQEVFAGGVEKSRRLAAEYEAVARAAGAQFLDIGEITEADGVDGLHLSEDAHRKIGIAIAAKIKAILGFQIQL